jgi:N-methylhydantoinase B/oxoprolinase/acetone carboxylase alpha subunit
MLEESERLFAQTGRYHGIERLSMLAEDPIRYEKIFSRLRGGMVNARETALNISASPIVKEIGELCFALYTPEGDSITLSTGIMVHVHTMSDAIKWMIRHDYEVNPGLASGDIFCNNDAMIGDVHNADAQTILPLFWKDELIGWAAGVTHVLDVGAGKPSGMPIGPVNRFEDGWILSCEKIGARDEVFRDYELRSETAVRMPWYWRLDEKTRIAGCQMIRDAVHRVLEEEGVDTYKRFVREVIEEGRRSFETRVKQLLVPGIYRAPSFMDVPFEGERELPPEAAKDILMHAPMQITVGAAGEFAVSFDGASKWGMHSFNAPPSAMQGALWVLLTQTLVPNDKVNDGAYFATKLDLPYGSWTNPDNPFVSTTISWVYLIPSFTGLFRSLSQGYAARGYLEEVVAGYPGTWNMTQGGGTDHYGRAGAWTNFEHSCVGTSAGMIKDGEAACAAMWNPEGDMGDVEAWEILEPLVYLTRRIRPNTAGPGRQRGGAGWETIRFVWKTNDQVLYNLGEGHVFHGAGLFGGYPSCTGYRLNVEDNDLKQLIERGAPVPHSDSDPEDSELLRLLSGRVVKDNRCVHLPTPAGEYDVYVSLLRGGHGLGDVLERDPAAVEADVEEGHLLPRYAERIYGVVPGDPAGTGQQRAEIRHQRAERAVPVSQWRAQTRERVLAKDFIYPVKDMYGESMSLMQRWADEFRAFWDLPDDFSF